MAFPALLSICFLPITIICTIFAIYWAFRTKWYALLFVVALFLVRNGISQSFAMRTSLTDNYTEKRIKVMTQNVEVFNIYAWQKIENARDKILKTVMEENPDVLLFQEFYSKNKVGAENNNIEHFKNLTALKDYHFNVRIQAGKNRDSHFGLVIFSKFPISNKGEIKLENTRNQIIYCDVQLPEGEQIRIINAHLQSIYLSQDEFDFSYEKSAEKPPSLFTKPLGILRKLKRAYSKRGVQTNLLKKALEKSPHPVILCGDFNDTPVSFTYNTISKYLNDAFLCDGLGIGTTYAGAIPALRIDYIFADPRLEVLNFKKLKERNADHFGLVSEFAYDGLSQ